MSHRSIDQQHNNTRDLTLADYGWDDDRENSFESFRADGLVPARVVRAERGHCDVVTEDGPAQAAVPSSNSPDRLHPCTGDWVALQAENTTQSAAVAAILDRRTAIIRGTAARTSRGQVLAANVDTVAVVVSLAGPVRHGRVERMLALAWASGATPIVVLTKADRCADPGSAVAELTALSPGARVLLTSAATGEGVDALVAELSGTVVLLGSSGAGKSTLGNRLLGEDVLATDEIRETDGKGRHTTTWRELLPLPHGGVLVDTPGLRGIGLHDADDGLDQAFADIAELADGCRFRDCGHTAEPDCAVLAAVESGVLAARRVASYRRLLRENAYVASLTDARLREEQKRSAKQIARLQREIYRSGRRRK
ncbi:ribosome small subunit-dependent GTPase A [Gordonia sp. OPL2]|uniref:ribosome small subunit-dependent GTPase A n=1 Tax=Gordonia sp. OPL2 TaxID=2486274 RepID=UPI001655FB13|nr:ribosome small subunit-dependent GTPase A [Gordonia sp. OPL2]ROZ98776.1 ribosome small subunit-dependent GTPase A [Gordonia sp. OPL2]